LRDGGNNIVFSVTYSDDAPWPLAADGTGPSLVPNLPNSNPDPHDSANWRISGNAEGSPGADDPAPGIPKVQITELLANSVLPAVDAVELYNTGAAPADISGWYLSDDLITPKKYRIPDGTVIAAGSYLVLTEAAFNTGPDAFAFSQNGDEAVLSSANAAGNLTGYTEFVNFGASEPGVTFGRHANLETPARRFFTALSTPTLGGPNTGPKVGPVIISEVHYWPSGSSAEFIEIRNNSNVPVPLFDPQNSGNGWRLKGIDFTLPGGITLQPRQFLIVSASSPAVYRAANSVPAAVPIYGPFSPPGDLANSGERVVLQKPGLPFDDGSGGTVIPYIDADAVTYSSGWFSSTAGGGKSLERAYVNNFGDDKNSWKASSATPGNPGKFGPVSFTNWQSQWFIGSDLSNPAISGPTADPEKDGFSNLQEYAFGLLPTASDSTGMVSSSMGNDGAMGPYLMVTFRRSLSTQFSPTGVTISVDIAGTLPSWTVGAVQVGTPINNGDGTETVTYRDNTISTGVQKRFIRVKTSQ
jgi:hypothetical protein